MVHIGAYWYWYCCRQIIFEFLFLNSKCKLYNFCDRFLKIYNTYEDQFLHVQQIFERRAKANQQQRKFLKIIYLIKENKKVLEESLQNHKNKEEKSG